MAKNGKNVEDTVNFSNIFDFIDESINEKYKKRPEPVVSTTETRGLGAKLDGKPDEWMSSWKKSRKRVNTSPFSFHADELIPMVKGLANGADNLEQPFRDGKTGQLFGGTGLNRKGPQFGLPLDSRLRGLLGNVKRGDDIIDCYVRGLETTSRRKTYAAQQPPARTYGLTGRTRDLMDVEKEGERAEMFKQTQMDFMNEFAKKDKTIEKQSEYIKNVNEDRDKKQKIIDEYKKAEANERQRTGGGGRQYTGTDTGVS